MYKQLKIDPDFKNLIAPLPEDEYAQLEQNILRDGKCRDTIKIWRGFILDGHNRHQICKKHGLPYSVEKLRLSSKTDAKLWIAENQLGRRNLTKAQRIDIASRKAAILRDTAKKHNEPYHMRKEIANIAGVSEGTVYKYMKIAGSGSEALIERVKSGEIKIGKAHKALHADTREVKVLYDDDDMRFKDSPMCRDRVMRTIGGIGLVYGFLEGDGLGGLVGCDGDDRDRALRRLGGHVGVLEGVLKRVSGGEVLTAV